ncbi:MAG: hypothetical protein P1R58_09765 [bacterium]|nr:hypothetical protein [bacterium]
MNKPVTIVRRLTQGDQSLTQCIVDIKKQGNGVKITKETRTTNWPILSDNNSIVIAAIKEN